VPRIKDLIRQPDEYRRCLVDRNKGDLVPHFDRGLDLYEQWKRLVSSIGNLRQELNQLSAEYAKTRDQGLVETSREVKDRIRAAEQREAEVSADLSRVEIALPNWIASDVPPGEGEAAVRVIAYAGVPRVHTDGVEAFRRLYPGADFEVAAAPPFHHYDLVGDLVDQEIAGKVAQSRFYYEFDELVILDFAITLYALEFFRARGYGQKLMITPYLLRRSVEERITYLEAFQDTIYEIEKDEFILLPSSEHSVVAYYMNRIFDREQLPLRVMAWSPCFRREAGAHGRDTRGIFRVRQFHKLELHSILPAGEDDAEVERMRVDIQDLLLTLGLPNRSVVVPRVDMDKRATRQVDVETWLPGQGAYRETHSIATLGTWVAEKVKMRYRPGAGRTEFTRNVYGTGAAAQRLICAIAENHYDHATSSIRIPGPLAKYMMGVTQVPVKRAVSPGSAER